MALSEACGASICSRKGASPEGDQLILDGGQASGTFRVPVAHLMGLA